MRGTNAATNEPCPRGRLVKPAGWRVDAGLQQT